MRDGHTLGCTNGDGGGLDAAGLRWGVVGGPAGSRAGFIRTHDGSHSPSIQHLHHSILEFTMNALPTVRKESWLRAVILSLALATAVEGGPDRGAGRIDFPQISLGGTQRGQDAINALGARLPELAQAYGMTADQLHLQLRVDPTLAVDSRGRLLFLEPLAEQAGGGAGPVEDPTTGIPTPPTLWLYDASGNPVMEIPTPPTRALNGGSGEPVTGIPTPPTLWLYDASGNPVMQIPTPPTRALNGGSEDPATEIPTPPTRVSDEEVLGGAFEQIPTPPTLWLFNVLGEPVLEIPTPPTRSLNGGTGYPVIQIPTPPTRASDEEVLGGAFEQIPTPPTRSLSSGLLDPATQIPTPPTRWLFDAAGNPVMQIPTPPTRVLNGGSEDPATQIPTPPTRWLYDAAGNPVMEIPTPPTRSMNGGPVTPMIEIPTPPTRSMEGGSDSPVIQIPTPPTRASNEPLLDFNSQQIPTPPTRVSGGELLEGSSGQIPTPPTRSLNASPGNPTTQIPTPPTRQTSASEPVLFSSLVAPSTADALRLHSRPGAKRTLFLDFGGEVMVNNVWTANYNGGANIVAPAYDMDGDPTTFNETERSKIIEIWRRVAEDYAPFDVNVCTELTSESLLTRSSTSDDVYGVRVLFSPISRYVGNYGGVSYVGTFNDVGDYWKPSLVFTDTLGAGNAKNLAEAASHEAGHALGLSHDGVSGGSSYYTGHGSGETGWAPIMGVGYSRNVTQWSRGDYANANNKEDDLQVMQNYGLGSRADDHGNTLSAASYLPVGTALYAEGVIERSTDLDVFAFNAGAGALSLTVAPQSPGPNLDVWAELRDASGIVVATANPGTALAASFNLTVPAGMYFLSVKGDSAPTPPSSGYPTYGSLGNYSVTGTVVSPSEAMEPVAVAEASTVNGLAPLAVSFDGSRSFDPDGSLVSHEWNFGDGARGSGVAVSHSYAAAGVYQAVLTVTDNSGLSHSDLVEVTVAAGNAAPVAVLTASATTGTAPLSVSFSGAGSRDADGSIVSWSWNFGDGTVASGATVSKSYATAGTYVVALTVTDNLGGTGSATTTIVVNPAVQQVMRVESITMSTTQSNAGVTAWARVRITDPSGNPVPGVSVTGRWTGLASSNKVIVTDAAGEALIPSKTLKASGTLNFAVMRVVLTGYTYNASLNLETTESVVVTWP